MTTDKKKPHFLKIDFHLWVDYEEQTNQMDNDRAGEMPKSNFEEWRKMYAGETPDGGEKQSFDDLNDEEDDSDDEDLPNLE